MKRLSLPVVVFLAIAGLASPASASADEADNADAADAPVDSTKAPSKVGAKTGSALANRMPQDAAAALFRATAAYDYGDLNQVVEAARFITEGSLEATEEQQALAFRLIGIGLYLTNRPLGAEAAFTELLRRSPRARLDPTTTRPELVAFFESLRHQHLSKQRSTRKMLWNFIPPGGQFQNGDNVKAWAILGVGFVAATTAATSYLLHRSWKLPGNQSTHSATITDAMKTVNIISGAVLIAVYGYGVVDGVIGYSKPLDDSRPPVSLQFFPGGSGLGFTF